jgi:hypothetical protein
MTELWRRFPNHFDLIEAHPSGGLSDCLVLMTKTENPTFAIDVNRGGGSVHIHKHAFGVDGDMIIHSDWMSKMLGETPKNYIDEIANETRLAQPDKLPSSTPTTITYRYISDFLTHSVSRVETWYCLNGFNDSSGHVGGVRDQLFKQFPALHDRDVLRQCPPRHGHYEYNYWFLVRNGDPVLCLDTNGRLFSTNGECYDLKSLYEQKRRIWPLIYETAGNVLP